MIIVCENCNRKFDINADLIPENGRLLQCNSCNYTWFFKNEIADGHIKSVKRDKFKIFETINVEQNKDLLAVNSKNNIKKIIVDEKVITKKKAIKENKSEKKSNILNLIIIFIITFTALIILIDTFKNPLSAIFPNIEFVLYNLYETIKDITLFFKDLI